MAYIRALSLRVPEEARNNLMSKGKGRGVVVGSLGYKYMVSLIAGTEPPRARG